MMRARVAHLAAQLVLIAAACTGALAGTSCSKRDDADASHEERLTMDKADWLEKAAKLLRNGSGLGPQDDVDALLGMPEDAVVDRFMQDPRFYDMVLSFNLYFLGFPVTSLKSVQGSPPRPSYDRTPYDWPEAIEAARAVKEGGDYFDLFTGAPRFTVRVGQNGSIGFAGEAAWPARKTALLTSIDRAISSYAANPAAACTTFTGALSSAGRELTTHGLTLDSKVFASWTMPSVAYAGTLDCDHPTPDLPGRMRAVKDALTAVLGAAETATYPAAPQNFLDMPAVSFAAPGLPPLVDPLGPSIAAHSISGTRGRGFWDNVPVGSTNYQRKRASYILKTYFCDDLTPASIPDLGPDAGDVHAQNPACQSCHYRLDPIGALFRYRGADGVDESGRGRITFDDGVVFSGDAYDHYLDTWRNPDGSFRAGYYVMGSDGMPHRDAAWLDSYGDTISGLWPYLRHSEVVRSCLTRRLAEYVLGPRQVYDRDWLKEVSEGFESGPQSGQRFKELVKTLVLSKTFSTHDPEPGVCYDFARGASANRAPCVVASIVENQCAGCHRSPSGPGHLDFTAWIPLPDGSWSWAHTDHGVQLSRRESLARIRDRITSADLGKRMPLGRVLPVDEQNALRGWLDDTLGSLEVTP